MASETQSCDGRGPFGAQFAEDDAVFPSSLDDAVFGASLWRISCGHDRDEAVLVAVRSKNWVLRPRGGTPLVLQQGALFFTQFCAFRLIHACHVGPCFQEQHVGPLGGLFVWMRRTKPLRPFRAVPRRRAATSTREQFQKIEEMLCFDREEMRGDVDNDFRDSV